MAGNQPSTLVIETAKKMRDAKYWGSRIETSLPRWPRLDELQNGRRTVVAGVNGESGWAHLVVRGPSYPKRLRGIIQAQRQAVLAWVGHSEPMRFLGGVLRRRREAKRFLYVQRMNPVWNEMEQEWRRNYGDHGERLNVDDSRA